MLAPLAVSSRAEPSPPYEDTLRGTNLYRHAGLTVHCLNVGPLAANCYLVAGSDNQAVLIDPGAAPESLLRYVKGTGVRLRAYLLTHSHLDHLSALDELAAALPADVAMHPEEDDWAFCEKNAWLPAYPRTAPVTVNRPLAHLQRHTYGELSFTVIHTPGHSPGSVCFWFPASGIVFSGDTLFAGSVGRTDLHRSSQFALVRSLGVFLMMPPDTVLYAGHGLPSTLAVEHATNPFLRDAPGTAREGQKEAP